MSQERPSRWAKLLGSQRERLRPVFALLRGWRRVLPEPRRIQLTLGNRLFLVLVVMAAASSLAIGVMQDSRLADDLHRAAQTRLERASNRAGQLVDKRLQEQLSRYETLAAQPQFTSNVESRHAETLTRFAEGLAEKNAASAIQFLGPDGNELAGAGPGALRVVFDRDNAVRRTSRGTPAGPLDTEAGLHARDEKLYSVTYIPLWDDAQYLGSLRAVEDIGATALSEWSHMCGAQVALDKPSRHDELQLPVTAVGDRQLAVITSLDAEREALANSRKNLIVGGLVGLAIACAASFFLARSLVRPIRQIQAATERIATGDLHFRLDLQRSDEVGDVAKAFNLMLDRLEENIDERIRIENQISHLAYHDSLTGLANRRLLRERLETALQSENLDERPVAIIFIDLDRFKDINDTLGHTAGDDLLMEASRRLNTCLRGMGSAGQRHDDQLLLARLGGDEFTLLMRGFEDRGDIELLVERMLDALSIPFLLRGQEVHLSASAGIAVAPDDTRDAETLMINSDLAMYHAKNHFGRAYEFYSDSMHSIAARRIELENKLRRALEQDQFELFYQPKLDLKTNKVESVEALIRWHSEDEGLISPVEFIPLAEDTGTIIEIGEWVLREAIAQATRWMEDDVPSVRVSVNVSVRQIEHRGDFARQVELLLEETGFDPALLDLEITEGALLKDEEGAIELFNRLNDLGVGLSLDDFGTGYSSLSYLRRLPIDTLKIDRSFLQGAHTNPEEAALFESIVSMAKTLHMRVVAEGVETEEQKLFLEELGCDEAQGFLFSEPITASAMAEYLREHGTRRKKGRRKKKRAAVRKRSSIKKAA